MERAPGTHFNRRVDGPENNSGYYGEEINIYCRNQTHMLR
jgi:hypothetical protein